MSEQVTTYVDGESHYERLRSAWGRLHTCANLDQLRFREGHHESLILHIPEAKVFWARRWSPGQRTRYFTAMSGTDRDLHDVRVKMRAFELEPDVIHERKMLANQRRVRLEQGAVIEKAKGVDCAIIVTMLEDAHLYATCNLYTSDVDYARVIQAVQGKGKPVVVHGFKDDLGEHSELEYIPSKFIDLARMLSEECECAQSA